MQGPSRTSSDHPRACGEQAWWSWYQVDNDGSSPRVRGAVRSLALAALLGRIIPARAGSSAAIVRHAMLRADHPRACGEQFDTSS